MSKLELLHESITMDRSSNVVNPLSKQFALNMQITATLFMFSLVMREREKERTSDERIQNDGTIIINKLYCIDVSLPIFEKRAADFHVARYAPQCASFSQSSGSVQIGYVHVKLISGRVLIYFNSSNSEQLYVIFDVICELLKIDAFIIK